MAYKESKGRPLLYNDVNELEKEINNYFDECDKLNKPYTMGGLAYHLGIDRNTLLNYEKRNVGTDTQERFFRTISRAREKVAAYTEILLYNRDTARGAEFSLKNNFGWTDRKEIVADVNTNTISDSDRQLLETVSQRLLVEGTGKIIEDEDDKDDE